MKPRPPYRVTTVQYVIGVLVAFGLFWLGFAWAIPTLGRVGWVWLAWIAMIFALNTYGYLRSRRR